MIKHLLSIIRLIFLKIKYRKRFVLHKNFYNNIVETINNVTIVNGSIEFTNRICMKKGARLGVNHGGKIILGSCCFFNSNSICASLGKITIGNNVSIGPNVCIYDHDHSFNENGKIPGKFKIGKVIIGNNVWIGAGAIVLRDTVIGDNCIIGAGTVVKGDIPPNSLVTNDRDLKIVKLESRIKGKNKL